VWRLGDSTLQVFWWLDYKALGDGEDDSSQQFMTIENEDYGDDDDESKDHRRL